MDLGAVRDQVKLIKGRKNLLLWCEYSFSNLRQRSDVCLLSQTLRTSLTDPATLSTPLGSLTTSFKSSMATARSRWWVRRLV